MSRRYIADEPDVPMYDEDILRLIDELVSLAETHENQFMLNKYNLYAEFSQVVEDKRQELLDAIQERIAE